MRSFNEMKITVFKFYDVNIRVSLARLDSKEIMLLFEQNIVDFLKTNGKIEA